MMVSLAMHGGRGQYRLVWTYKKKSWLTDLWIAHFRDSDLSNANTDMKIEFHNNKSIT